LAGQDQLALEPKHSVARPFDGLHVLVTPAAMAAQVASVTAIGLAQAFAHAPAVVVVPRVVVVFVAVLRRRTRLNPCVVVVVVVVVAL